jgi:hypothetical protein
MGWIAQKSPFKRDSEPGGMHARMETEKTRVKITEKNPIWMASIAL